MNHSSFVKINKSTKKRRKRKEGVCANVLNFTGFGIANEILEAKLLLPVFISDKKNKTFEACNQKHSSFSFTFLVGSAHL